jgi:DNA-binding transcriptional MerR regulator/methylmalonyl-CoA mutase cobalamin-binding subunit
MKPADNTVRQPAAPELYPIRTVATLTGVNPITLRAWERRYGLIKPTRTESGHRLYTQNDIDNIHRIVALLDKGVSISQVRNALSAPAAGPISGEETGPWANYRTQMITAITQFDEERLEDLYNEILAIYPADLMTRKVLLPLLVELGTRWETAEGSVAEEHFFGVYLRNKLGARFHHRHRHATGPKILAACLPGEQHEIGLLLFALAANDAGFRLILLGGDMPLADLPHAARRSQCDAIVLSGSIEPKPSLLMEALPQLVAAIDVPVFVGGLTSIRHRDAINAAAAQALGNDLHAGLKRIGEVLSDNPPTP